MRTRDQRKTKSHKPLVHPTPQRGRERNKRKTLFGRARLPRPCRRRLLARARLVPRHAALAASMHEDGIGPVGAAFLPEIEQLAILGLALLCPFFFGLAVDHFRRRRERAVLRGVVCLEAIFALRRSPRRPVLLRHEGIGEYGKVQRRPRLRRVRCRLCTKQPVVF